MLTAVMMLTVMTAVKLTHKDAVTESKKVVIWAPVMLMSISTTAV